MPNILVRFHRDSYFCWWYLTHCLGSFPRFCLKTSKSWPIWAKLFDDVKIKFWLFHEPSRDMKISFSKPPWWVDTFWGQNFVSMMCSSKVMAKNVFATFGNRKMSTRKMTTLELELRDFFPGSNRCFSISRCLQLIEN